VKILSFRNGDDHPRSGVLVDDDLVVDIALLAEARSMELPGDVRGLVEDPDALRRLSGALAAGRGSLPSAAILDLSRIRLCAPLRPGKVVGVGLNYVAHVEESSRTLDTENERPTRPVLFSKPATAVVGPGEPIRHDGTLTSQLDWECELAVVIGRTASRVSAQDALDHVFGYSIINDISARDQRRSGQWFFSKGQDSYAPFGPWIVTADEIEDPQALDFRLTVNGDEKQNSNTQFMLFSIAQLIEDISSGVTLEPGDVIATGSAEGVGAGQVPPQFLQPGDTVELTIEKIGTLSNPVVAV
jgi:2-keto-4-pentenoate hydratase/2-oxohepta-3-ene-1,7-dioic acid hydratase in catechol pathway